jgi:hypothetical protein
MLIDHEKQLDHVECLLFLKEIGRLINDYKLCKQSRPGCNPFRN